MYETQRSKLRNFEMYKERKKEREDKEREQLPELSIKVVLVALYCMHH